LNIAKLTPSSPRASNGPLLNKLQEWDEKKLIIIHGQAGQGVHAVATHIHSHATPAACAWTRMMPIRCFIAGLVRRSAHLAGPDVSFRVSRRTVSPRSVKQRPAPLDHPDLQRLITRSWCWMITMPWPRQGVRLILRTLIDATPPQVGSSSSPGRSRRWRSPARARRARRAYGQDLAFDDGSARSLPRRLRDAAGPTEMRASTAGPRVACRAGAHARISFPNIAAE
jgi:hypothetical protein